MHIHNGICMYYAMYMYMYIHVCTCMYMYVHVCNVHVLYIHVHVYTTCREYMHMCIQHVGNTCTVYSLFQKAFGSSDIHVYLLAANGSCTTPPLSLADGIHPSQYTHLRYAPAPALYFISHCSAFSILQE